MAETDRQLAVESHNAELRREALARLLAGIGWSHATRHPLAMDASTRRYERLRRGERTLILMDAPCTNESPPCPPDASAGERLALGWNAVSRLAASRVEAFVAIGRYLRGLGLSAPEVLAFDARHGWAVIEDLGANLYAGAIPAGADEVALYVEAAHALALAQSAPLPASLPASGDADGVEISWPVLEYDETALAANADLFVEWGPRLYPDLAFAPAERMQWERARAELTAEAMTFPRAFTIRDYHAENLIWLPERNGPARVGLLDFQDAVIGWRSWDLVMLLQDARRDVGDAAHQACLRAFFEATGIAEAQFRREFAILGALNALRILGIFSRLIARDGKNKYRAFLAREWGHLRANLAHEALAPLQRLIASRVPVMADA